MIDFMRMRFIEENDLMILPPHRDSGPYKNVWQILYNASDIGGPCEIEVCRKSLAAAIDEVKRRHDALLGIK